MAQTKVIFIELNVQNKFRHTCDIVEKFYTNRKTVTIFVESKKNASTIDRQLWVWKQELFIPHKISDDFNQIIEEPILITSNNTLASVTDILILFDPIPQDVLNSFQIVIDFAEVYNPSRLKLSRERYKALRTANKFEMHFFKLGGVFANISTLDFSIYSIYVDYNKFIKYRYSL